MLKRIHVKMHLKAADRATAERVHGFYAEKCPVYRSLKAAIQISTELDFQAS